MCVLSAFWRLGEMVLLRPSWRIPPPHRLRHTSQKHSEERYRQLRQEIWAAFTAPALDMDLDVIKPNSRRWVGQSPNRWRIKPPRRSFAYASRCLLFLQRLRDRN